MDVYNVNDLHVYNEVSDFRRASKNDTKKRERIFRQVNTGTRK